jgi:aspartate aminotransferase
MSLRLSRAVAAIPASPTLSIDAKAKALRAEGIDVLSFGAGEPDMHTPVPIVEAAIAALQAGHHKYTPVSGTPALKKAIADAVERQLGVRWQPSEIIASCGAKHSLYNLWLALLDPGDEVLVPTPAWVSYITQIEMTGARAVEVPGAAADGFVPTIEALEAAYTPRTRALLINNPTNPTGALWDGAAIARLAEWVRSKPGLIVISDAIYDQLVYDQEPYVEMLSVAPDLRDRYVLINGISKAFAMTGWRLGWTLGPAPLIAAMERLQSQSTSNPTAVTQAAAVRALELGEDVIAPMRARFQARRDLIARELATVPGWTLVQPRGAFYAFPDASAWLGRRVGDRVLATDTELAAWLLEAARVAVVPGSAFAAPGYLRLSYAMGEETILEGIRRIREAGTLLEG